MQAPLPAHQVQCTQCGGDLNPDEGQIFLTCPYCGAAVYLDKSKVVFHWSLAPTLDEAQARGALARWMAGNETVKDLDQKAQIVGSAFEYFPLWVFKRRVPGDKEEILIEPAAATSVSELRQLKLPAGDLRKYESALDSQSHAPSVPLPAALEWLAGRQIQAQDLREQFLVHVPIYTFKYLYQGKPFTALVEGGTGRVFANIYPSKAEAPYLLAGAVAALTFLCLATFPLIGWATNDTNGAGIGLLVCTGAGLIASPFLFALAAWVAAKI